MSLSRLSRRANSMRVRACRPSQCRLCGEMPIFIGVLNGSFIFLSILFVKLLLIVKLIFQTLQYGMRRFPDRSPAERLELPGYRTRYHCRRRYIDSGIIDCIIKKSLKKRTPIPEVCFLIIKERHSDNRFSYRLHRIWDTPDFVIAMAWTTRKKFVT